MHYACKVITQTKCVSIINIKLVQSEIVRNYVTLMYCDMIISVCSVVLMVESYCMTQLMSSSRKRKTVSTEIDPLRLFTDVLSSNG